jgi:hypothetical protein
MGAIYIRKDTKGLMVAHFHGKSYRPKKECMKIEHYTIERVCSTTTDIHLSSSSAKLWEAN